MSERVLNRLTKEDLLSAEAKVREPQEGGRFCFDLLYVPGAEEGTRVLTPYNRFQDMPAPFPHKYQRLGAANRSNLHAIHMALIERRAGIPSENHEEHRRFVKAPAYNAEERENDARELSKVLRGRDVFVATTAHYRGDDYAPLVPGPKAKYYAAPIQEVVNVQLEGGAMQFEPVVSTDQGEGLLPRGMWMYQGIYVPTSVQDIELLERQAQESAA